MPIEPDAFFKRAAYLREQARGLSYILPARRDHYHRVADRFETIAKRLSGEFGGEINVVPLMEIFYAMSGELDLCRLEELADQCVSRTFARVVLTNAWREGKDLKDVCNGKEAL